MLIHRLACFLLLAFSPSLLFGQTVDSQIVSQIKDTTPDIVLQVLGGAATMTGCYYALNGKSDFSLFPLIMPVFTGAAVGAIAELTTDRRSGSYWASIGGAFVGTAIGGFIYGHLKKSGVVDLIKIPLFAAPVLTLSCLFFNSTLEPYSLQQYGLSIIPWTDATSSGIFFQLTY